MHKAALYFALGLETGYLILRVKGQGARVQGMAVSCVSAAVLAAFVSALQILVPGRNASVSYIIIAAFSALAGSWLADFVFKCGILHVCGRIER